MFTFKNKLLLLTAMFPLLTQTALSQNCLTADQYPDEWQNNRYSVHNDGTVTDTKTQLMWKTCSEGQIWNAGMCEATQVALNWQVALQQADNSSFASYTDWRIPNQKELKSIVAFNCVNPSINETVFPNTAASGYWSSSPYANASGNAWRVDFSGGDDDSDNRDNSDYVRLVRSGQ